MSSQRNRIGSTSACKCDHCERKVKHDDATAIGCQKCGCWFHRVLLSVLIGILYYTQLFHPLPNVNIKTFFNAKILFISHNASQKYASFK